MVLEFCSGPSPGNGSSPPPIVFQPRVFFAGPLALLSCVSSPAFRGGFCSWALFCGVQPFVCRGFEVALAIDQCSHVFFLCKDLFPRGL